MSVDIVPKRLFYKEGDTIVSKYRILKELGDGAFGQVYKVVDRDNNLYALKVLRLWDVQSEIRKPLVDRFEMEFQTGLINSVYLVHSVEHGIIEGNPYIVMEYCPGGDLSQYIGKKNIDFTRVAHDVLCGLYDLHVNGKVHRDLKPENVLFKSDNTAVLADFGISGDRNKRMTECNILGKPLQIFGTYAYMPPEQVDRTRGGATVLPTTDIFSFGVMMYQLLVGELPFGPLNDQNDLVRYQKRSKNGEWNRDALLNIENGAAWVEFIDGCLKPNYKVRLQNVKSVMKLLPTLGHPYNTPINNHLTQKTNDAKGALLRVMHGDEYGKIYELTSMYISTNRRILTMGRATQNDITIREDGVVYISRFHCTLETDFLGLNWKIRDGQWRADEWAWRQSSNGTYINSVMVGNEGLELQHNDIISIGDTKLRYELY